MESGFPGFLPGSDSLSGIGRVTTPPEGDSSYLLILFVKIDYIAMMVGQVDNAQVGRPI